MNIQFLSDCHCEFYDDNGSEFFENLPVTGEVLVLAGDIFNVKYGINFEAMELLGSRYSKVVLVAGNHEFYHTDPKKSLKELEKLNDIPGVAFLNNSWIEVNGQRFIGGTMWFKDGYESKHEVGMNDFWQIKNFKPWVFEQNAQFVDLLKKELKSTDVVISHHLPSFECVARQFSKSALNSFFVNEMDGLIEAIQPKAWIFGHTHVPIQATLGDTLLICNPRGYPGEDLLKFQSNVFAFDPEIFIEV